MSSSKTSLCRIYLGGGGGLGGGNITTYYGPRPALCAVRSYRHNHHSAPPLRSASNATPFTAQIRGWGIRVASTGTTRGETAATTPSAGKQGGSYRAFIVSPRICVKIIKSVRQKMVYHGGVFCAIWRFIFVQRNPVTKNSLPLACAQWRLESVSMDV